MALSPPEKRRAVSLKCATCEKTFAEVDGHDCAFAGRRHASKHARLEWQIRRLEERIEALEHKSEEPKP